MASGVGSCRVKSAKVGRSRVKSGEIFFSGSCCRYAFASVFARPEPAPGSGKFSKMLIHCSNRRQIHAGELAMWGRASGPDGLGRVMSGQSGQFSLFWSFALDFEHDSSLFSSGYGQFTDLHGPCLAFRFPACGSHRFMMTRSQQCQFVSGLRAIISLFLKRLPCHEGWIPDSGVEAVWRGNDAGYGRNGLLLFIKA